MTDYEFIDATEEKDIYDGTYYVPEEQGSSKNVQAVVLVDPRYLTDTKGLPAQALYRNYSSSGGSGGGSGGSTVPVLGGTELVGFEACFNGEPANIEIVNQEDGTFVEYRIHVLGGAVTTQTDLTGVTRCEDKTEVECQVTSTTLVPETQNVQDDLTNYVDFLGTLFGTQFDNASGIIGVDDLTADAVDGNPVNYPFQDNPNDWGKSFTLPAITTVATPATVQSIQIIFRDFTVNTGSTVQSDFAIALSQNDNPGEIIPLDFGAMDIGLGIHFEELGNFTGTELIATVVNPTTALPLLIANDSRINVVWDSQTASMSWEGIEVIITYANETVVSTNLSKLVSLCGFDQLMDILQVVADNTDKPTIIEIPNSAIVDNTTYALPVGQVRSVAISPLEGVAYDLSTDGGTNWSLNLTDSVKLGNANNSMLNVTGLLIRSNNSGDRIHVVWESI